MKKNTNEEIRYISFKLFLEKGYEATNIREICREINIKPSSLYFYYPSKQALFFHIYDDIWSSRIDCIEKIIIKYKKTNPDLILFYIYKYSMEYFMHNIVNEKFLLRYHLFPPSEIESELQFKYKSWSDKLSTIYSHIIEQCIEDDFLDGDNNSCNNYVLIFKRFIMQQLTEVIVSNIRLSEKEIHMSWSQFWNCKMICKLY